MLIRERVAKTVVRTIVLQERLHADRNAPTWTLRSVVKVSALYPQIVLLMVLFYFSDGKCTLLATSWHLCRKCERPGFERCLACINIIRIILTKRGTRARQMMAVPRTDLTPVRSTGSLSTRSGCDSHRQLSPRHLRFRKCCRSAPQPRSSANAAVPID